MTAAWLPLPARTQPSWTHVLELFSIIVGDDTVGISRVFISSILLLSSPLPWVLCSVCAVPSGTQFICLLFLRSCYVIFCCFPSSWPSLQGLFPSCRLWRTPDPGQERVNHNRLPAPARFSLLRDSLLSKRV